MLKVKVSQKRCRGLVNLELRNVTTLTRVVSRTKLERKVSTSRTVGVTWQVTHRDKVFFDLFGLRAHPAVWVVCVRIVAEQVAAVVDDAGVDAELYLLCVSACGFVYVWCGD